MLAWLGGSKRRRWHSNKPRKKVATNNSSNKKGSGDNSVKHPAAACDNAGSSRSGAPSFNLIRMELGSKPNSYNPDNQRQLSNNFTTNRAQIASLDMFALAAPGGTSAANSVCNPHIQSHMTLLLDYHHQQQRKQHSLKQQSNDRLEREEQLLGPASSAATTAGATRARVLRYLESVLSEGEAWRAALGLMDLQVAAAAGAAPGARPPSAPGGTGAGAGAGVPAGDGGRKLARLAVEIFDLQREEDKYAPARQAALSILSTLLVLEAGLLAEISVALETPPRRHQLRPGRFTRTSGAPCCYSQLAEVVVAVAAAADLDRKYGTAIKRRLRTAVYDAMIVAVLDAMRNLDLSYSLPAGHGNAAATATTTAAAAAGDEEGSGAGGAAVDMYGAIVAHNPRDMMSYFYLKSSPAATATTNNNLPDTTTAPCCTTAAFLQDLLPACGSVLFARWALALAEALAALVSERPLLSASYSLAAVAMELAERGGLLAPQLTVAASTAAPGAAAAAAAAAATADIFRGLLARVATSCPQYKARRRPRWRDGGTDELLVSCLGLLLAAPPHLLAAAAAAAPGTRRMGYDTATIATSTAGAAAGLAVPLTLALPLGLSYMPVAEAAVTALERWEVQQPAALKAAMPYFVPLLEPYLADQQVLQSDEAVAATAATGVGPPSIRTRTAKARRRQRETAAAAAAAGPDAAAQLQALQARLQLWLGRNPTAMPYLAAVDLTVLLAAAPSGGAAAAIGPAAARLLQHLPWDEDSTKIALDVAVAVAAAEPPPTLPLSSVAASASAAGPTASARVRLYVDPLLPHAARLAEESPDPQVRTAAAELLHAAALWVVGANAALPEVLLQGGGGVSGGSGAARGGSGYDGKPGNEWAFRMGRRQTHFHGLLRRLFPAVLRLGASHEPLARDLFRQLAFQLVHWYTRGARREGAEAMALLDAVLMGLSTSGPVANAEYGVVSGGGGGGGGGGSSLRDLCASLCAEWLVWAQRQNISPLPGAEGGGGATADADAAVSVNATSLLRRLMDRLAQPSPDVRQGAAAAFAALARPLSRPYNISLANGYLLEALWLCIRGLRHPLADEPGSGTLATAGFQSSPLTSGSDSSSSSGSLGYGASLVRAITALVHHCLTRQLAQQLCLPVAVSCGGGGGGAYYGAYGEGGGGEVEEDDGGSELEEDYDEHAGGGGDGGGGGVATATRRQKAPCFATLPALVLWLWQGTGGLAASDSSAAARRESMRLHARLAGAVLEVRGVRQQQQQPGVGGAGNDPGVVSDMMELEEEEEGRDAGDTSRERPPPPPPLGYSGRWLEWRCAHRGYDKLDVLARFVLTLPAPKRGIGGDGGDDSGAAMETEDVAASAGGGGGGAAAADLAVPTWTLWLRSLQAALEWTTWALDQGMLKLRDLPDLVEKARGRARARAAAAATAAATAAAAAEALPDTLTEFLCLLPPVEEGIRVGEGSGAAAATTTSSSGGLPPGCRTATRDVCLALLRLMRQLADLEMDEQQRRRRQCRRWRKRQREGENDNDDMASAASDVYDTEDDGALHDSGALLPWSDKDAVNVALAAALAPHLLGLQPSDGDFGTSEKKRALFLL
ncbi:hypothetical protein VOLCADRAFT_87994 [Volvox carteri f. nagariensis]|uniref:DNA-dependent protein kinase catalytic subunit CC1/2 domain-containing protein n=1 Tax=Volvox carteri f. nagariensis TaxID=3068 RepID=D8TMT0_VOLCA|nr:uncharacterized protein VOLCADRAFT_87994 [Volvox carteri f. nagariensis]EFJ51180.1 hypothetical protein VOLCADRAFT_87994 [Volvox carteri f. nagariensis]|eukprot:XP_002947647.1 hypothetical protein VOLCADRAFT_87994 [Volvox carteri f. nagariensis]